MTRCSPVEKPIWNGDLITKRITIALAGNPNTGKSTLFNKLTGDNQEIGNWPGKTVEKKTGHMKHNEKQVSVVDLPGIYSLSAFSIEERIAREFIVEAMPDVVVSIVDSSNLERNLYLTIQLLELGAPVVIAFNMIDVAEKKGMNWNVDLISKMLGVPVVPIIANKRSGIDALKESIFQIAAQDKEKKKILRIDYGEETEAEIEKLGEHIRKHASFVSDRYGQRWTAVKLIEKDSEIIKKMMDNDQDIFDREFSDFIKNAETIYGKEIEIELADRRYAFIRGMVQETFEKKERSVQDKSDKIDDILINRWLGIPIFLAFTYILYTLVFTLGRPFVDMLTVLMGIITENAEGILLDAMLPDWIVSLIVSGIIPGIGNVLVFLPNIALLFLAIAFMEDSGYMARVAFVMDKLMRKIGLQGKSFIPLVIAFGCNVPAIMAARTIEDERDRIVTIMINSLIPCSSRMTVFVFIASALFAPEIAGQVVWSLVVLSFCAAIAITWIFKLIYPSKKGSIFVIELPSYRLPTIRGIMIHSWNRTRMFVKKAGTFIFFATIILWFLSSHPYGSGYGGKESYLGQIGQFIAPVFAPLEIEWRGSVALLSGFFAKETIISAMGVLYGSGGEMLQNALLAEYTPLQAYVFMVFVLFYIPCLATVSIIKKETNSWRWTAFAIAYTCALAWIASFIVLYIGHILGY